MPENLTREQLVGLNPGIDEGEMARIDELMNRLRQLGEKCREYRLASPATSRRVKADSAGGHHRVVHLGHRR